MSAGVRHSSVRPVGPVYLLERFPPLHQELMALLGGLGPEDWHLPTACALWSVKDIVAHLLDTQIRRLSAGRDRFIPAPDRVIASYPDLVDYLNHLNAEWIAATRRLSPPILMNLLDHTAPQVYAYFR